MSNEEYAKLYKNTWQIEEELAKAYMEEWNDWMDAPLGTPHDSPKPQENKLVK